MDYSQFNKPPATDYSQFNKPPANASVAADVPVAEAIPDEDKPESELYSLRNVIKTAVDYYTPRSSVAQGQESGNILSELRAKLEPEYWRAAGHVSEFVGADDLAAQQRKLAASEYESASGRKYLTDEQIAELPPEQGARVKKMQEGLVMGTLGGAWDAAKGLANLAGTTAVTVAEPVVRAAQYGSAMVNPLLDKAEARAALDESLTRAETRAKALPGNVADMVKASVSSLGKTLADPGEQLATDPFAFLTDALTVAGVGASTKGALAAAQAGEQLGLLKTLAKPGVYKNIASAASDISGLPVYSYKGMPDAKALPPVVDGFATEASTGVLQTPAIKAESKGAIRKGIDAAVQSIFDSSYGTSKGLKELIGNTQASMAARNLDEAAWRDAAPDALVTEVRQTFNDKLGEAAKKLGVVDDATAQAKGLVKLPGKQFFGDDLYVTPRDYKFIKATAREFMLKPDKLGGSERVLSELRNLFTQLHVVGNIPSWINASVSNVLANVADAGVVGLAGGAAIDAFKNLRKSSRTRPLIRQLADEVGLIDADNVLSDAQLANAAQAPTAAAAVARTTRDSMADWLRKQSNALQGKDASFVGQTFNELGKVFGAIDNTSKLAIFNRYIQRAYSQLPSGKEPLDVWLRSNPEVIRDAATHTRKFYPEYDLAGTGVRYLDRVGVLPFATYAQRSMSAMYDSYKQNPALFGMGKRREDKSDEVKLAGNAAVRVSGVNPYVNPYEYVTGGKGDGRVEFGGLPLLGINTVRGVDRNGRPLNPNAPLLSSGTRSRAVLDYALPGVLGKMLKMAEQPVDRRTGKQEPMSFLASQVLAPIVRPGDTTKYDPIKAAQSIRDLKDFAKQEIRSIAPSDPEREEKISAIKAKYETLMEKAMADYKEALKKQPQKK